MVEEVRMRKVVVVEWGDAFIDTDDFDPEEARSTEPVVRSTVGFFIAKNQHGVVLATDVYRDESEVAAKMFIPNGMIYSMKEYSICGAQ